MRGTAGSTPTVDTEEAQHSGTMTSEQRVRPSPLWTLPRRCPAGHGLRGALLCCMHLHARTPPAALERLLRVFTAGRD